MNDLFDSLQQNAIDLGNFATQVGAQQIGQTITGTPYTTWGGTTGGQGISAAPTSNLLLIAIVVFIIVKLVK